MDGWTKRPRGYHRVKASHVEVNLHPGTPTRSRKSGWELEEAKWLCDKARGSSLLETGAWVGTPESKEKDSRYFMATHHPLVAMKMAPY